MCVTSDPAELSGTFIGGWDVNHPEYGKRRVMVYENTPENHAARPNCMLLHVPAVGAIMPEHFIDTSAHPTFLRDIYEAVKPRTRGSRGMEENFVHQMGIYHIAVVNTVTVDEVSRVLTRIPVAKRPVITQELIEFYMDEFPGWPIVLCCFNNQDAAEATPIMFHYEPQDWNEIFFPTLEAHGTIPQIGEEVEWHQKLVIGFPEDNLPRWVTDVPKVIVPAELKPWLPKYAASFYTHGSFGNDDRYFCLDKLDQMPYGPKISYSKYTG